MIHKEDDKWVDKYNKQDFVDYYVRRREYQNMEDSLRGMFDNYILPLQSRIASLEDQIKKYKEYCERNGLGGI
jgi:predicted ribosome quality control (RQC) complex YloA/Tae2 family protein